MTLLSSHRPLQPLAMPLPQWSHPNTARLSERFQNLGTDVTSILVPGLSGSGPEHWQSHWEQAFDLDRVHQDDWENPDPDAWERTLNAAILATDKPVILIAHSLGAVLATRWLHKHGPKNVAGAFLVAPADVDQTTHADAERIRGFAPLPSTALPVPTALVASTNDPWLAPERAHALATQWRSDLIDAGAAGHLGSHDLLGLWAQGASALLDFVDRRLTVRQH